MTGTGNAGTPLQPSHSRQSNLEVLFGSFPHLQATFGGQDTYRQFRLLEQHLVSILDEVALRPEPEVLVLRVEGRPAGVTSFLVETNVKRPEPPRKYARVDLVITESGSRGLGIGRLMIYSVLTRLLETEGKNLYSISCLAAHPAVEHVLSEAGFSGEVRPDQNFRHMGIRLDQLQLADYKRKILVKTSEALRVTNYRLRQCGTEFTARSDETRLERFRQRQTLNPAPVRQS